MPILGQALASYVMQLDGLFSIELPITLYGEIVDLVNACNATNQTKRALLVVEPGNIPTSQVELTTWPELLGWRTADNRVFAWIRGSREPDTSFQSVVKPFISSRFPGSPSGECSLELFAEVSVRELWRRRNLPPLGEAFDSFLKTAQWVASLLSKSFELVGSKPGSHWSDEFMLHWAKLLRFLDSSLANHERQGGTVQARHAWEIIRLAGFPVPFEIVRNSGHPFLEPPKELESRFHSQVARRWQEIAEEYVYVQENIPVLLTALDRIAIGTGTLTSWRGLDWDVSTILESSDSVAAPVAGQSIFASANSPSLISIAPAQFPAAPLPSWWGVHDKNLQDAIKQLKDAVLFEPAPSCQVLGVVSGSTAAQYWVRSRSASVSFNHTAKNWRAKILISDMELIFKHTWTKLIVSLSRPAEMGDGYVWLEPNDSDVELKISGAKVLHPVWTSTTQGGLSVLSIKFSLEVQFSGSRDQATDVVIGRWIPMRAVTLKANIHDCVNGDWKPQRRQVSSGLKLLIPSPFSPTATITNGKGKVVVIPGNQDEFMASMDGNSDWQPESTPTILLDEEGEYELNYYDGRIDPIQPTFIAPAPPSVTERKVQTTSDLHHWVEYLDDNDTITASGASALFDVGVVNVKERSGSLSSGLLSAINRLPSGRRSPSQAARESLLGRYQDSVVEAITISTEDLPNSLYHYVVTTNNQLTEWPAHAGTPTPQFTFPIQSGSTLPGIGNGPSDDLVITPQWHGFMAAFQSILDEVGLDKVAGISWLSGFNPAILSARSVRGYLLAHRELIRAARQIGTADVFWATYPFSVVLVQGDLGPRFGQLTAVLLSPLHPIRLAWSFSLAFLAGGKNVESSLLGLAEGWNIPYTGVAVNATGRPLPLVAIPTDPGEENDFAAWSALAVLDLNTGLADLPATAIGKSLPWGGKTGINRQVVVRAIRDYLTVHPHVNSLSVDLRTVSETPRSREIDEAVLQLLAGPETIDEIKVLGGGVRIWDSSNRLGSPPSRDALHGLRTAGQDQPPFEWRTYAPGNHPEHADIAFVENASVNMDLVSGQAPGVLGLLLLRRFCPPTVSGLEYDQDYSAQPGEDLLGMADLLDEIEYSETSKFTSLRARPTEAALGIGLGARWEILGTFNLDPSLLSAIVNGFQRPYSQRLLWEWRPSWLGAGPRNTMEISHRPYYVIGTLPTSLLKALEHRQGITTEQATQLLVDLGRRGIGLTSLHASGGTQESAAAGFFYTQNLLLPRAKHPLPANWILASTNSCVSGLVPVDPIETILEAMRGKPLGRRADFLGVRLTLDGHKVRACFIPIEVKHHGQPTQPEAWPGDQDRELNRAREQLEETANLLKEIAQGIQSAINQSSNAPAAYARLLALATIFDLALSFTPATVPAGIRAEILRRVLVGRLAIGIGTPLLLWFAPGSSAQTGQYLRTRPYNITDSWRINEIFLDPAPMRGLWWDSISPSGIDEEVRGKVDEIMLDAISSCTQVFDSSGHDIAQALGEALGLTTDMSEVMAPSSVAEENPEDVRDLSVPSTIEIGETSEISHETQPIVVFADDGSLTDDRVPVNVEEKRDQSTEQIAETLGGTLFPRTFLGWSKPTSRWTIIGKLATSGESVGLDFDNPKTVGIFGYMGSGKSYLLGGLIEAALEPIPGLNSLTNPLAVVIFNYRRNPLDRFELSSLALPNRKPEDVGKLAEEYGVQPRPARDLKILCLPGELTETRLKEYGGVSASELLFKPSTLTAEDWELLMGEPGSNAVFARSIRHALRELHISGKITLENLESVIAERLSGQSLSAAQLRFEFIRGFLSQTRGIDFNEVLKPGRALILDLRQPLFDKADAMRFFLVCANNVSRVQGSFNKLIVFDEAHEYLSNEFGEKIDARIRFMRHEGTSYVFATQDVASIPLAIRRFITTRFVFNLGTRENIEDLLKFAPEFEGQQMLGMPPGDCLIQANESIGNVFSRPRIVHVRPRVTQHGGTSRIFSEPQDIE